MTETDAEVVERVGLEVIKAASLIPEVSPEDWGRLFALARRGADAAAEVDRLRAEVKAALDLAERHMDEKHKLRAALREIKWRSADKDNMEFSATITYSQMDKIRAALGEKA